MSISPENKTLCIHRCKVVLTSPNSPQASAAIMLGRRPSTGTFAGSASPVCRRPCLGPMARSSRNGTGATPQSSSAATTTITKDPAAERAAAEGRESQAAVHLFPEAAPGQFIDRSTAFMQEFPVRGNEVAPNQFASMVTIANLLQELAANHAVGMWGRAEKGFAGLPHTPDIVFVMTRLQIRMFQYPKWGDILRLQTFFAEENRLQARRDWLLQDVASGKQIGAATSSWVNINMKTRRLCKLPDDLKNKFMQFATENGRSALPAAECKKKLPDVDETKQTQGPPQIARRSDMDMNGHINNVVYVAWALEAVPADVYDNYSLYEMEIDFKAECQAGDTVQTLVQRLDSPDQTSGEVCFLHSLKRSGESGPTELVRARTTWRK